MKRSILVVLVAIAAVAVVALALARLHGGGGQTVVVVEDTPAPTRSAEPSIVVDVAGAVVHPGVYRLAAGSRIADGLTAAGGATDDADLAALNKAALVRDGQRVGDARASHEAIHARMHDGPRDVHHDRRFRGPCGRRRVFDDHDGPAVVAVRAHQDESDNRDGGDRDEDEHRSAHARTLNTSRHRA